MLRAIAIAFLLLCGQTSFAQQPQPPFGSPVQVRKFTDEVMSLVGIGKYEDAWRRLKSATIIPAAEFDAFASQFARQLHSFGPRYGEPGGHEHLRDQLLGDSLLRSQYIAKYERSAVRWTFIFYRTSAGWVLSDFKFDQNLNALFPSEA